MAAVYDWMAFVECYGEDAACPWSAIYVVSQLLLLVFAGGIQERYSRETLE